MSWSARLPRYLVYAAVSVFVLAALLIVSVHIQQHIFRYHAERLSKDIRSLQVRRATFSQATSIIARWSRSGSYDIPCSREYCDLSIRLGEFGEDIYPYIAWRPWAMYLYHFAGGRLAFARASISVREGIVWHSEFELDVEVPLFQDAHGRTESYVLEGRVSTIPRASEWYFHKSHPDYDVGGPSACEGCAAVWVSYTPYAGRADIDRVGQPNFDCITRWSQCRTKADFMPGAMAQRALDDKSPLNQDLPFCSPQAIQVISRDAEDAAIVDLLAKQPDTDGTLMKVRLIKPLKGATFWKIGSDLNLGVANGIATV